MKNREIVLPKHLHNNTHQGTLLVSDGHVMADDASEPINRRDIYRIIRKAEIAKPLADKLSDSEKRVRSLREENTKHQLEIESLRLKVSENTRQIEAGTLDVERLKDLIYRLSIVVGKGNYNVRFWSTCIGIGCKRVKYADVPKLGKKVIAMMGRRK